MREDLTGRVFGGLKVIEPALSRRMPSGQTKTYWVCECLKCGSRREYSTQTIKQNIYNIKYQDAGCAECREKLRNAEKIEKLKQDYQGKEYGELTIDDIVLGPAQKGKRILKTPLALCTCCCGRNDVKIPLKRILEGGALTCGHNTDKNFKMGHDIVDQASVAGTNVLSIRPTRKINKNNITGVKGVSQRPDGRYRAYINFRRKQYHLGLYDDIKLAAEARKAAEEKIYGNFLEWYAQEYPECWERINVKNKNQEPD